MGLDISVSTRRNKTAGRESRRDLSDSPLVTSDCASASLSFQVEQLFHLHLPMKDTTRSDREHEHRFPRRLSESVSQPVDVLATHSRSLSEPLELDLVRFKEDAESSHEATAYCLFASNTIVFPCLDRHAIGCEPAARSREEDSRT